MVKHGGEGSKYIEIGSDSVQNQIGELKQAFAMSIASLIGYLAGVNHTILLILMLLMASDIIVAVIIKCYEGEFVSSQMKKGILIKISILIMLMSLILFELALQEYGVIAPFGSPVAGILCANEFFSIVESLSEAEMLPAEIAKWFKVAKGKVMGDLTEQDEDEEK